MDVRLEQELRQQIADLNAQIAEYDRLLYAHETVRATQKTHSKANYGVLFEHTGTGAFVKEADMTISKVNSEFERLTGYAKTEIEGRMKWTDFFLPEDHSRLAGYHSERRGGSGTAPKELECRIKDSQGAIKHVYLTLDLIPETGKSIGSFMDITRLKAAEAQITDSKALLAAIVEGFDGMIYVVSDDFNIQYINEQLLQKVGRPVEGQPCYRALHNRTEVCPFCVHEQVFAGETVRFEIKNPRSDRWYYSVNAPIHQADRSIFMLSMVTDIHDRKTVELSLKENEHQLRCQNRLLRSTMTERNKFGSLVGQSKPMQEVYEQIINAAASDATVVVYGEPGTGKELVAHAIHDMSLRHKERFVPVHCGAIPEALIEAEFFGYEKGAFSGAGSDRQGYVDFAHNGTLFMDEVGEISPHMQVKLLRVIEGGGYTPVGSNQIKHSDIRIIAATNRDMQERMDKQMIRKDFFYRIHILPIYLPPLRSRKDDLPLLVDHFMMLYGGKKNLPPIAGPTMDRLMDHDWPGNVRELQNVVIRYCHSQKIELMKTMHSPYQSSLPDDLPVSPGRAPLRELVDAYEKKVIEEVLTRNRWHRSNAARLLGVDRKTLFTKMKRHGLNQPLPPAS